MTLRQRIEQLVAERRAISAAEAYRILRREGWQSRQVAESSREVLRDGRTKGAVWLASREDVALVPAVRRKAAEEARRRAKDRKRDYKLGFRARSRSRVRT